MNLNLLAILGAALAPLLLCVVEWLKQGQAQRTGGGLEAGAVSAASATTQAAVAQAVVDAPATQAGLVDQLNKGNF